MSILAKGLKRDKETVQEKNQDVSTYVRMPQSLFIDCRLCCFIPSNSPCQAQQRRPFVLMGLLPTSDTAVSIRATICLDEPHALVAIAAGHSTYLPSPLLPALEDLQALGELRVW